MSTIDGSFPNTNPARSGTNDSAQNAGSRSRPTARIDVPASAQPSAANNSNTGRSATDRLAKPENQGTQPASETAEKSVTDLASAVREQADSGTDRMDEMLERFNSAMEVERRSLRFRINEDSNSIQMVIVDANKDKVIRTIPSDEMLKLAARMRELSGIGALVDESR